MPSQPGIALQPLACSTMSLIRAFTEHPASVGETYSEHLANAVCFGTRMMLAGIACLVHGVLPFLFQRTGSRAISELNGRLSARQPVPPVPPVLPDVASDPRLPL
jgi:Family of unknown function (DUF6356)